MFISQVFSFEDLGFEEMDEEIFRVYFREIELGELDVTGLRLDPSERCLSLSLRSKRRVGESQNWLSTLRIDRTCRNA